LNIRPKVFSFVWMILLTVGVIAVGYFSAESLKWILPTYKQEITPMEDKRISQRLYGDNNQLSLYPWIYYDPSSQWKLEDYEKKILDSQGFNFAFREIFDPDSDELYDFTENATTGLIGGEDDFYDIYSRYYSGIFVKNEKILDRNTGVTYQVDCAVADDQIVYFHKQPEDREIVHREQLERAYRLLSAYIGAELGNQPAYSSDEEALPKDLLPKYLKQVNTGTAMYPYSQIQQIDEEMFDKYEGDYAIQEEKYGQVLTLSKNNVKEIYMTDQELILEVEVMILKGVKEIHSSLVLFFDPVELEFCGFSFQIR
jgi:hypothetical protein